MNMKMDFSRKTLRWQIGLAILAGVFALTGLAGPCWAQACITGDLVVSNLNDGGAGSLRAQLAAATANPSSEICFSVTGTITLASPLTVTSPVTINDPSTKGITLSGNGAVQVMVVNLANATDTMRLNGLTMSNGSAKLGGGIQIVQGAATLVGTAITSNHAIAGGGVYNQGSLTLSQCLVSNNTATNGEGGGIANVSGGTLILQNSVVSGNTSPLSNGGGLYNSSSVSITSGSFTNNQAVDGGGIYNDGNGVINDNASGMGGTLYSLNQASQDGGAIYNVQNLTIGEALFNGNVAQTTSDVTPCGGALCNNGNATITESTFAGNTTNGYGGAIESYGTLTLYDDTIATNTATGAGSGLSLGGSGVTTVNNTIIAGNTAIPGSATPDCQNCANITGVANLIGVTANLGPLANNGGLTQTMMPLPGGAAVNAGNALVVQDDYDQRGFTRLNGEGVDIGAVQSHYSSVSFLTQPSNTAVSQTIAPPVAVQVVEVDGSTTNYPQGVPVTVTLLTSLGASAPGLSGTLTQLPTVSSANVTAALFADLSVNTAGSYELFATSAIAGNSSSANPAYSATSNIFQIANPTVVTLAWQPAPVTYGPMPQSELDAVATINNAPATGTFVYTFTATNATINVGQVYTAGSYGVQVAFTPTGATNTYTLGTVMQITQAIPVVHWTTPAPIYTSTPLSTAQLDATATGITTTALPGTFAYNPAAGATLAAGPQMLSTTFTPTDTVDYTTATGQVTVEVNAPTATSVVIQESGNPIIFGQTETLTAAVTGNDSKPFTGGTASFTSDGLPIGSATVVNGTASISTATLTAGTHQIGVSYTNATLAVPLTNLATLIVNKATPTLAWAVPAPIFTTTPLSAMQLDASASGVTSAALAGTFIYKPASGTTLGAGPQLLTAAFTPSDAVDYSNATVQVTIQVNAPTAASIVIQESANPITFGQSETLTAVVNGSDSQPFSGGTASFTSDGTSVGSSTVVNGTASVVAASLVAGTHQIGVSYTSATLPQPLTSSVSLTVNKAVPVLTWAAPTAIYTSTALSATQLNANATGVTGAALPGAFVYTPAAGATLAAGPQVLNTTFTPTDTVDYTTLTAHVTIQVNPAAPNTLTIQESANPITFGQRETLTAVVTGSDSKPFTGGTASFTSDGTAIGSAPVVNGTASVIAASLAAGTHQIGVSYTNSTLTQPLTSSASLTINKATPTLTWVKPVAILTSTPLNGTQLDATATGITGTALAGSFVYNPASGTTLSPGSHTLSATFTPTDTADYITATAQVTIQVGYSPISITSTSPSTITLSTNPVSIVVTGTGFTSSAVAEVNGTPVVTSVQNATTLTATIPATLLTITGTLNLTVYDSGSKNTSNLVTLTVTAPSANVTISIPSTTASGEQPVITIAVNSPYPTALSGTLTLAFAPDSDNGVDDPSVQFSTGGRTFTFSIAAGSMTTPQVALQTGTVAGTITVTLTLDAGGVNVTPPGLAPTTLVIAPEAPVITGVSFINSPTGLITVVINGFSNTREMTQANFTFTGSGAGSLGSSNAAIPVTSLFAPWYSSSASDAFGSEFTYTQNFQLSTPDSSITGVSVTLSNSIGISGSVNSQ